MKSYKKNKYFRLIPLLILVITVGAIGTSYAWSKQKVSVENKLTAHTTDVEIIEDFDPDPVTDKTEQKKVQFKNNGSSSVFLRITYTEYWEKINQDGSSTGELLPNQTLNRDGDLIDCMDKLVRDLSNPEDPQVMDWKSPEANLSTQWFQGDDGWYYYKAILGPGENTDKILDYVTISNLLNNCSFATQDLYAEANYHLYFQVEAVQASDSAGTLNSAEVNADATWTTWGKTATVDQDGNVTWSATAPGQEGGDNS